jgi:hypothetical protein
MLLLTVLVLLHIRGTAGLVAVCISGQTRTFLNLYVQTSFVRNFHHPGYEYYLSIDRMLAPTNAQLLLAPIRGIYSDSAGESMKLDLENRHSEKSCPVGTMTHPYYFPQMVRFVACHQMLLREETQKHFAYDYVIRTRTDALFLRMFPPPRQMFFRSKGNTSHTILIFDDHLAIARRAHADVILLNPSLVYRECHDAHRWARACTIPLKVAAATLARMETPCQPMNLILTYSADLNLTVTQCGFLHCKWCVDRFRQCTRTCAADLARLHRATGSIFAKNGCHLPRFNGSGPPGN